MFAKVTGHFVPKSFRTQVIKYLFVHFVPTNYPFRTHVICGWSGGAMVLGKHPVPGRPTIWMIVGQGPTALAVGAGGVVWTFLLSSILSLLCLFLFGRRPDID